MKKASIVILTSLYLLSTTGLSELTKVNVLLQHYADTKKANNSIGFCEFLIEHYLTDDGNPNDNDMDAKLPFKSHDIHSLSRDLFVPTQLLNSAIIVHTFASNNSFPEDKSKITNSFYNMVWHPPKYS
ncbi:MAG: hypothetical protein ABI851_11175 [Saprospiraceae bacterium]